MAYAFEQQMPAPVTDEIYEAITGALGDTFPEGLVCHLAIRTPNGLRYIDIWESREQCERFTETRLHPAVGRTLAAFRVDPGGEPERLQLDLVDAWTPTHREGRRAGGRLAPAGPS